MLHQRLRPRSSVVAISGTLAGVPVTNEPIEFLTGYRATAAQGQLMPVVGALGSSFFQHRVLILDYPEQRFAIMAEGNSLPDRLSRRAFFISMVERNGKLYVPITIDGVTQDGYFFDTGASAFSLMTSPSEWRQLTGRAGNEASNRRLTVSSWGSDVNLVGAPVPGPVSLPPVSKRGVVAYYSENLHFSYAGPGTNGLFGNELFADHFVVVVDRPRHRFGVAQSVH